MHGTPQTIATHSRLRLWLFMLLWWAVALALAIAWFCVYPTTIRFPQPVPYIHGVMFLLVPNLFITAWIAFTSHRDTTSRFPVLSAAARGALLAVPLWLLFSLPALWQQLRSSNLLTTLYSSPILNLATVALCYALIGATVGSVVGIVRDFIPHARIVRPSNPER